MNAAVEFKHPMASCGSTRAFEIAHELHASRVDDTELPSYGAYKEFEYDGC